MHKYDKLADLGFLIQDLRERAKTSDPQARFEIMKLGQELILEAETEAECITRVSFGNLEPSLAITGCETGIFKHLSNSKTPVTDAELAKIIRVEPKLLIRYTRALAAYGLLDEVGPGVYQANKATHAFAKDEAELATKHIAYTMGPTFTSMPDWLSKQDPHKEVHVSNLSFHEAFSTKEAFYPWVSSPEQKERMHYVAGFMSTLKDDLMTWSDVFPVLEEVKNTTADQTVFVDIGGSFGHRTLEFQQKFPALQGRLIVQDYPSTSAASPKLPGIEFMPHDAFTTQPVRGAKFYYMRYLLHDYSDDDCVRILKHTRDAMALNSVVLIDEIVLADIGNHSIAANWDMAMLTVFGSHERTLDQWQEVAERAGLKVRMCQVYKPAARNAIIPLERDE